MPTPTSAAYLPTVARLVAAVLGRQSEDVADPALSLKTLRFDEIHRMELVCDVEEEFGVNLDINCFDDCATIADLVDVLAPHFNHRAAA